MTTGRKYAVFLTAILLFLCLEGLHWYMHGTLFPTFSAPETTCRQERFHIRGAVLLWAENGIIEAAMPATAEIRSVVRGEHPRWSPDGTRFVFTRDGDVWLMDSNFSQEIRVFENVVTDYGTGAYWTADGNSLTMIPRGNPHRVIRLDLVTGEQTVIHDERLLPFRGYSLSQCAETRFNGRYLLTFTTDAGHRSMIVDLRNKRYITNAYMKAGDCGPSWSPDGKYIVMTRRVRGSRNRPLYITRFDYENATVSPSEFFIGEKWCSDAAFSNDSRYVAYVSDGNVFICNVEQALGGEKRSMRITDNGQSSGPNLYIFGQAMPPAFR